MRDRETFILFVLAVLGGWLHHNACWWRICPLGADPARAGGCRRVGVEVRPLGRDVRGGCRPDFFLDI